MKKAHHFLTLASGEMTGFEFVNHTVVQLGINNTVL
jgi:hypothetical protein